MFGDYIDRGSAGAIFSSPTNPDQVIKIINLDSLDDFTKSMNNQQFKLVRIIKVLILTNTYQGLIMLL